MMCKCRGENLLFFFYIVFTFFSFFFSGGDHFTRAELIEKPIHEHRQSQWSWQFFEKEIPIPEELREKLEKGEQVELTLSSKCFNTAWNVQVS